MNHSLLVQMSSALNKHLTNLLNNFDKNKESTDISSWLFKVE